MSGDGDIWRDVSDCMLARVMARLGFGLAAELLDDEEAERLSPDDVARLVIALGVADQIEARYGPSSARLWFDNPNVFLNSGDKIRPIEMLASDDPDRYSKLQCALNIHLGEPLYDQ